MNHSTDRCPWAVCLAILGTVAFAGWALAIDTAFWKPYEPDKETHALLHFDDAKLARADGQVKEVKSIGAPAFAEEGRFGGALKLSGADALEVVPSDIFPGGSIAVEAWVRLDKLPQDTSCILWRPSVVDKDARYDPAVDTTKGFSLLVDSKGAFHFETTNCGYGRTVRTSSPPGTVPVGRWVHLAGMSAGFPVSHRRLYVNGKEVVSIPVEWGQGIIVHKEEEQAPSSLYIGNNAAGSAGLVGLVDEVRVHRRIFKFWEKEDMAWARANDERDTPAGPPYFLEQHRPVVHLPLDGDTTVTAATDGVKAEADKADFVQGVRRKGIWGKLTLSAPQLLDLTEGAVEFWMQPVGVSNMTDRNVNFLSCNAFTFYIFNGYGPGRPVTMYFRKKDGTLHFVHDGLGTEYHEGRWYHIVITWKGEEICLYVNGKQGARSTGVPLATPANKGVESSITFNPYGTAAQIDEVYLYGASLLEEEVANAYH